MNTKDTPAPNRLGLLGVSVHWLQTGLLASIESTPGLSRHSRIYEIEDLRGEPGVVRQKGASIVCPMDGQKGCAYVHALGDDPDKVGPAAFMLSYTWGYEYGDIVDTLSHYCQSQNLNPKRSYIWICFLCVNQHRVVQNQAQGKDVPFEVFRETFQSRVLGTGHILAMMAPWEDPYYLKRVWCVFEFYQAHEHGIGVTILIPPSEMESLEQQLLRLDDENAVKGINSLYDALGSTQVEKAQASMEDDRIAILNLVKEQPGFTVLNRRVNELLRDWIHGVLVDQTVGKYAQTLSEGKDRLAYATVCVRVGEVLRRNNHNIPRAKELFEIATSILAESEEEEVTLSVISGPAHCGLGLVLEDLGQHDNALRELRKALEITMAYQDVIDNDDPKDADSSSIRARSLALCHANIGSVLYAMGDYVAAMKEYQTAIESYNDIKDETTAVFHNGIAEILRAKGQPAKAQFHYNMALKVQLATVGENHPDTATSYNNSGLCDCAQGRLKSALQKFGQALTIRLLVLGREHMDTAATYLNRGMVWQETRRNSDALKDYQEALAIQRVVSGGEDHLAMATCQNNLGNLLKSQADFEGALVAHQEALRIRLKLLKEENHPDIAISYNNIGNVYEAQDNCVSALEMYQKAFDMLVTALGKNHPSTQTIAKNIERTSIETTPASDSWKGMWKKATDEMVPIHFDVPKVQNIYIQETYLVPIGDELLKVSTGGVLLLTLEDNTTIGYSIKDLIANAHLICCPKSFYKGQLNCTTHKGKPYYDYAMVRPNGQVSLQPKDGMSFLPKFTMRYKLLHGPPDEGSSMETSLVVDSPSQEPVAAWKYNAEEKKHAVTITGSGCDIGLIVLLVIVWDRIDGENRKAADEASTMD